MFQPDFNDAVFAGYAFYTAVILVKMVLMSMLTGMCRIKNKVFANPEDAADFKTKVNLNHPDVERIRRAHLNDLENIPAFCILGYLYAMTNPNPFVALMCFRAFAAVRITHTVAYILHIFKVRGPCFGIGFLINLFMGANVILHFI